MSRAARILPSGTSTAAEDGEDSIILSVRLASGRFESSLQCPLFATDEERRGFVESWLKLMEAGLRCGREHKSKTEAQK